MKASKANPTAGPQITGETKAEQREVAAACPTFLTTALSGSQNPFTFSQ